MTSDEVPRIQPAGALTEVRFATPKVGYVFGGDLWLTRDAGRSFTRFSHPGQTVLDVEIHRGDVVVVTADGCTQGRCAGPVQVSRTTIAAPAVSQPVATRELSAPIDDAQVVVRDGAVLVQPHRLDGDAGAPWRLQGSSLVPVNAPAACGTTPIQSLTAASNGPGTLFGVCGGTVRGVQAEYRLVRSADRGRTWQRAAATPVLVPRVGRLSLAAGDDAHLVVSAGGPRRATGPSTVEDRSRLLQTTADGGRTWVPVATPAPPPQGLDWVASPGGREVYGITRAGSGIWRSSDLGATWQLVDPTRAVNPPPSTVTPSR